MGGLDVGTSTYEAFEARLTSENHTLKRALTDPRLFSGIGNAYSDEILHRAKLSPLALTSKLDAAQRAKASRGHCRRARRVDRAASHPDRATHSPTR